MSGEVIGFIIGESTVTKTLFISKTIPRLGQYVVMEYDGKIVLGLIQGLIRGSIALPDDIHDASQVERIKILEHGSTQYIKGVIQILGDVYSRDIPRIPPPPGTEVRKASKDILRIVFGHRGTGIRIGSLISEPDVPVFVDVNRMVTRHLAILAITGAGKSNTVAVIADELLRLNGTVVIFDMHSEYIGARFTNGSVNEISAKINPYNMSISELLRLLNIERRAYIQERYFRRAYKEIFDIISSGENVENFLDLLISRLESYMEDDKSRKDKDSIAGVINKIEDFRDKYSDMLDYNIPTIVDQIRPGYVNVVDLGRYDEEAADVIVSHSLRTILNERKNYVRSGKGLRIPIFLVLEEAHILAPKDRPTLSKYWIGRIAREGRKFGVGMCIVSQRPKSLDPNTLSQANNMIVLRLVEPSDQKYVQQASETLSEDLLQQLSSLNIGEAVVLGLMVNVPALVKIDKFKGELAVQELNVVKEWKNIGEIFSKELEDFEKLSLGD